MKWKRGLGEKRGKVGRREGREGLTSEALLWVRESCGIRAVLEGETGGEMERSWILAGLEKEEERDWRWVCPTWCAEDARPSCPNRGSVNLFASLSIS